MTPAADARGTAERYVRGELAAEERERFEQAYFESDLVFEELRAAEAEALDDYAAGRSTPSVRAHLEATLLASPEGRERLAQARALARLPSRETPSLLPATRPRQGWLQYALAASLALASLAAVWLAREQRVARLEADRLALRLQAAESARESETEQARALRAAVATLEQELASAREHLEVENTTRIPETASLGAALVLTPTLLREGGSLPTIAVSRGSAELPLLLTGLPSVPKRVSLRLETVEGTVLWSRSGLTATSTENDRSVAVSVACQDLETGTYILTLLDGDGDRARVLAQYALRVRQRP